MAGQIPMSLRTLLIASLTVLSLALAGCHEPVPADPDGPADPGLETGDQDVPDVEPGAREGISLSASDVPQRAAVGEAISFEVTVLAGGDVEGTSDHAGAHWSTESTAGDRATLQPADFDGASPHGSTDVPGTYNVTGWTFDEAGTYHFRAHVIFQDTHYWGSEHTIVVGSGIAFETTPSAESVAAGESFSVDVTVTAASGFEATTDHAGAHWSRNSTADQDAAVLTPADFDGASPHTSTDVPGSYTISGWSFDEPGTYYYRAHTIVDGAHFWGEEQTLTVS